MSAAVICDECEKVVKKSEILHCSQAKTHANGLVYGADICDACLHLFDKRFCGDGWHLAYREKGETK